MSIGKNLRKARLERRLTQEALGVKLGIAPQTISKWERGESLPDAVLLPKLTEILGISLDRLFDQKAASFEDATAAVKNFLSALDEKERWRQAVHLGQVIQVDLSGFSERPETKVWEEFLLGERYGSSGIANTGGLSLCSRQEMYSYFTLFCVPTEGWEAVLEKDEPARWEALANGEVRKALRAIYNIRETLHTDRSYMDKLLGGIGLTSPEVVLRALEKLEILKRRIIWLDGKESEVFILYPHIDLLQILLLGNVGAFGTVAFSAATSSNPQKKETGFEKQKI